MTRDEKIQARKVIELGLSAARDVDKLLDLYEFATHSLYLFPKALRALERAERRIAFLERQHGVGAQYMEDHCLSNWWEQLGRMKGGR